MSIIASIEDLEEIYGRPGEASLIKVADRIIPGYRRLIEASPFVALATSGPEGLDCSPRGDAGQAVRIRDDRTLLMADRRGNNRMDSLRNIVRDGRVAMMFLIPGSDTTLRVNGTAVISVEPELLAAMAMEGKLPRTVVVISIGEIYFQCARAVMRARLWEEDAKIAPRSLPTPGELLKQMQDAFDAESYDRDWPGRAKTSMW
ncbi:hypothetical protein DFR52_1011190 [Hoeflea marina]|uniref:Pyridoxamine 5'-phosphate oxidase N-terminal domain-containing protein n=1 Tax=Hoeflea marina TaxID=274592 RepID=A0A317PSN5_9HYPH|nr:pyridoxamine 5'-phosphate oxidase family protein [Hoeflea marina]PWW04491.1 hypothetical protein DFR52_1011190 [Hoeflea marina]